MRPGSKLMVAEGEEREVVVDIINGLHEACGWVIY